MNARTKPPTDGDILAGSSVLNLLPLYRERASEFFALSRNHAEVARICMDSGDERGAMHAYRQLTAFAEEARGIVENIRAAQATNKGVKVERANAAQTSARDEEAHRARREAAQAGKPTYREAAE